MCPKKWTISPHTYERAHIQTHSIMQSKEKRNGGTGEAYGWRTIALSCWRGGISATPQVLIKNAHQYEHIQSPTFRVIGPHLLATFPLPLFFRSRARVIFISASSKMAWSGQPSAAATRNAKRTINTRETLHGHDMMLRAAVQEQLGRSVSGWQIKNGRPQRNKIVKFNHRRPHSVNSHHYTAEPGFQFAIVVGCSELWTGSEHKWSTMQLYHLPI